MAGQRQLIELVLAKGSKHLTKKEIEERKSSVGDLARAILLSKLSEYILKL